MTRHRFIRPFDLSSSELLIDDVELLHQWQHVLRLEAGETVILCDGQGREAEAEILSFTKKSAQLRVGPPYPVPSAMPREITLYFSPLKRENTELILQKATEIGVQRFVPIRCRRTIKQEMKYERLQKILVEASEQSGRGTVPVLEQMQEFPVALRSTGERSIPHLFFELGAEPFSVDALRSHPRVDLFIGPEGGWDPQEGGLAQQAGCLIRSVGTTTLRAETAAIVACALALQSH